MIYIYKENVFEASYSNYASDSEIPGSLTRMVCTIVSPISFSEYGIGNGV